MASDFIGIDVAKSTLACWSEKAYVEIPNNLKSISKYLSKLPSGSKIAIENTGAFHLTAAKTAYQEGFEVYVMNPRDCSRYRMFAAPRSKTDKIDAEMIAHFAEHAYGRLRRFVPLSKTVEQLRWLVHRRELVVKTREMLEQSFSGETMFENAHLAAVQELKVLAESLKVEMVRIASKMDGCKRILEVSGIGPVISSVLMSFLAAGKFESSDAFVAFAGVDCRAFDSGKYKGKRKISKQGDRLLRKMIYLAAWNATRSDEWNPYYKRLQAQGMTKVQAIVVIARKLLRVVWSMYTYQTHYDPKRIFAQP
jgi:transposase